MITYYGDIKEENIINRNIIFSILTRQETLKDIEKGKIKDLISDELYLGLGDIIDSANGSDLYSQEEMQEICERKNINFLKLEEYSKQYNEIIKFLKDNMQDFNDLIIRMQEDINGNFEFLESEKDYLLLQKLIIKNF